MAARCPGVSITVLWLPLTPVLCVQCDINLAQDEDRVLWLVGEEEDSLSVSSSASDTLDDDDVSNGVCIDVPFR